MKIESMTNPFSASTGFALPAVLLLLSFTAGATDEIAKKSPPVPSQALESKEVLKNNQSQATRSSAQNNTAKTPKQAQKASAQASPPAQKAAAKTRRTASSTASTSYPPPPADRETLPAPIQEYIQAIEDVCNIGSFKLEDQKRYLRPILDGLKEAIAFYTTNYLRQTNPSRLNEIDYNLFNEHMEVFWDAIFVQNQRWLIAGEFLFQHRMMVQLPDGVGPEYIERDWAKKIYRGLHCLSKKQPYEEKKRKKR